MLGEALREWRKKAGLTQAQLGHKLDVGQSQIGKWERNENQPRPETLEKIAEILKVPISRLFGHTEKEWEEANAIWSDFPEDLKDLVNETLADPEAMAVWMRMYYKFRELPPGSRKAIMALLAEEQR